LRSSVLRRTAMERLSLKALGGGSHRRMAYTELVGVAETRRVGRVHRGRVASRLSNKGSSTVAKQIAIYVRVSSKSQDQRSQLSDLEKWVVCHYCVAGDFHLPSRAHGPQVLAGDSAARSAVSKICVAGRQAFISPGSFHKRPRLLSRKHQTEPNIASRKSRTRLSCRRSRDGRSQSSRSFCHMGTSKWRCTMPGSYG
jgi:hypothetical protein